VYAMTKEDHALQGHGERYSRKREIHPVEPGVSDPGQGQNG